MEDAPRVAVIGLGKIGLPLAAQYATKGAAVIGVDLDDDLVTDINAGRNPLVGEDGLEEALATARKAERLRATTDARYAVSRSQVVVVIVPVGIDGQNRTDYRHLDSAATAVAQGLKPGTLVIVETTVPVGTTRDRFGRDLSLASGISQGDFLLAYSPERVYSGRILQDLKTYPKLVGGVNEESAQAAARFYRQVLDAEIRVLPDCETAELAKLFESIYRDVNIALANELARAAESLGLDYEVAARAANSQPFSHLHSPGLGVGGHCIPVYPYFLLERTPEQRLVALGREVNDSMAEHGVSRLEEAFRQETGAGLEGRTVLVLGLSYRGGVKEAAHSSAIPVAAALRQRGAKVLVNDPWFSEAEIAAHGLECAPWPPVVRTDAVILQAAHPRYSELDLSALDGCLLFLDGRGAFDRARVEAAGIRYLAIGLGR